MNTHTAREPRRRRLRGAVLLCTLLIVVPRLFAQSEERPPLLTLDTALTMFRARGFDLLIADAAIEGARADEVIANALPNPSLTLGRGTTSTYDPTRCQGCSSTSISASVTDQGALSDIVTRRRELRLQVARAALGATRQTRADLERTLEFTVKQQLLAAELARESLANARAAQSISNDTLHLVEARFNAGAVSEADVARAETQKLEVDQSVDLAAENLASAKGLLAFLLGYRDVPDLDVADDLTRGGKTTRLTSVSRNDLLVEARAHRPDLAAMNFQVARARSSLALAERLRIPDFQPSLQYSAEGRGQSALSPPTITFGISTTLPALYHYRGEMAKATADLHAQELQQEKIDAQIASDVDVAYAAFTGARNRVDRFEGRLLGRSARARDLVRFQYEKGAASLFELLDAQRTFLSIQLEYLQAVSDYWTAVFQIEQATATESRR
jgi:cobalt-zinc-cadmium efflux system outer membrane protein